MVLFSCVLSKGMNFTLEKPTKFLFDRHVKHDRMSAFDHLGIGSRTSNAKNLNNETCVLTLASESSELFSTEILKHTYNIVHLNLTTK